MDPHCTNSDSFNRGQIAVLESIAKGIPLAELLDRIVRLVEGQGPHVICSILLLDSLSGCLRSAAGPRLPEAYARAIDGVRIGLEVGSCGTAAYRKERIVVEDIRTHPYWANYRDLALGHGLAACWSSPIFSAAGEVLGTFAIYYREPRLPLPEELCWVDAATHLAAIGIERDRAALALQRSESEFRVTFENAGIGIVLLDRLGRPFKCNPTFERLLGYGRDELAQSNLVAFTHPEDAPEALALYGQVVAGERDAFQIENRFIRKDGGVVWGRFSVTCVRQSGGALQFAIGMVEDVTEPKESAVRIQRLARLYAVSSSINEAIVRIREPRLLYDQACRIAVEQGLMKLAWIGVLEGSEIKPVASFGLDDGYLARIALSLDDPRTESGPGIRAFRTGAFALSNDVANDPGFFWKQEAIERGFLACATFPLKQDGRVTAILSIYADQVEYFRDEEVRVLNALAENISFAVESAAKEVERRRMEEKLASQALLLERVKDAVLLRGLDGVVSFWNPGAERLYGWTAQEALGQPVQKLIYHELTVFEEAQRQLLENGVWSGELIQFTKNSRAIIISGSWTLMRDEQGRPKSVMAINTDVSERKKLEAHVLQSQRLESLGRLAGGIAHDFNNILTSISGNAQLVSEDLAPDHPSADGLQQILSGAARASELVRQILTFSRQQEPRRKVTAVGPILHEATRLLQASLQAKVQIRVQVGEALPNIMADPTQLHQVIMNLATNAAHAVKKGAGEVVLSLTSIMLDATQAVVSPGLKEGLHLCLSVADNGCGMDEATMQRIFEPFFSTKPQGEGTGLGLSVVHGIVSSHQGAVQVQSKPGQGTVFKVYFPAVALPLEPSAIPKVESSRGRGERVLYVDDESALVQVTEKILGKMGYSVAGYADVLEALEVFRAAPQSFNAVVTDLAMPKMSGTDFAREVLRIRQDIPVILISGFVRDEDRAVAKELGLAGVVLKPGGMRELAQTLHRALQGVSS